MCMDLGIYDLRFFVGPQLCTDNFSFFIRTFILFGGFSLKLCSSHHLGEKEQNSVMVHTGRDGVVGFGLS